MFACRQGYLLNSSFWSKLKNTKPTQRLKNLRYDNFLDQDGKKILENLPGEMVLGKESAPFLQPFIIRKPVSNKEWKIYHQIRKVDIFDPINVRYNSNHSSIHDKNHHHFIFLNRNEIVGVLHIQQMRNRVCAIRSIAIKGLLKNHGLGTILLELAEKKMKEFMCETIHLHANPRSYSFYKNSGYVVMPFFYDASIYPQAIDMGKNLRKRKP